MIVRLLVAILLKREILLVIILLLNEHNVQIVGHVGKESKGIFDFGIIFGPTTLMGNHKQRLGCFQSDHILSRGIGGERKGEG